MKQIRWSESKPAGAARSPRVARCPVPGGAKATATLSHRVRRERQCVKGGLFESHSSCAGAIGFAASTGRSGRQGVKSSLVGDGRVVGALVGEGSCGPEAAKSIIHSPDSQRQGAVQVKQSATSRDP